MKHKAILCALSVCVLTLLASCATGYGAAPNPATTIELSMTSEYDSADPFVNAKLFYVTDDVDSMNFEASLQAECDSALLEIADNESKEVIWSRAWSESADAEFRIPLKKLDKEKEYAVQLTCTGVRDVTLAMTPDSSLVKERARPRKSDIAS